MTGRKKDPIWHNFIEIKEPHKSVNKARCKKCDTIVTGLVARMKKHVQICNITLVDEDSASDSNGSIRSRSPSRLSSS
jgi:hypothetical protein